MGHEHSGDQNVSDPYNNKECKLINSNQSAFLFKSKRDKSPQHFLAMNHPESMEPEIITPEDHLADVKICSYKITNSRQEPSQS